MASISSSFTFEPEAHIFETKTSLLSPVTDVYLVLNGKKSCVENAGAINSPVLAELIESVGFSINYAGENSNGQATLTKTTADKGLQYFSIKIQDNDLNIYPMLHRIDGSYLLIVRDDKDEYQLVPDEYKGIIEALEILNKSMYGLWELAKACVMLIGDWN
eukprot:CAMPEP_0168542828 /NCGR_PEP_ID=MMETSP0413-20121227/1553_1 /TAXON_ID=136452 /ORGANISM="Filamoeba nolandi, Strain NC-AS-23-1" /LENGTH=160 /DNA_ID=CAMNT_0008572725 /DNA_START=97 /DNA_END=576 /DNA_ORIENTATION=+